MFIASTPHVTIRHHGSIVMVKPDTYSARVLMDSCDGTWHGDAMAVRPADLDGFLAWLADAIEEGVEYPGALDADSYTS